MDTVENVKVERLNESKQWSLWKFQVKIILKSIGAFDIVTGKVTKPVASDTNAIEVKKWDDLDIKAQRVFVQSIGPKPMQQLLKCDAASAMWKKLHDVFEQKTQTGIHFLQQKFYNAEFGGEDDVSSFMANLEELVQELSDLGEQISDTMVVTKVLMSLPSSYAHFHSAWDSTDEKIKTLDNLRTRLMIEEKRMKMVSENESGGLMAKRFHHKRQDNRRHHKQGKCFICGKDTHWKKDCPERSKTSSNKSRALCCESMSQALVVCGDKNAWYLDSGATEHMSPNIKFFRNYKRVVEHPVRIGNGQVIFAAGRGDIDIMVYNGEKWTENYLKDVLHVPDLFANLFSQGKVLDKGYNLKSDKQSCEFVRDGAKISVGVREHGLYRMLMRVKESQIQDSALASVTVKSKRAESLRLWHERLAHQNIVQVKQFLRRNNINFVDEKDFVCEACIYGKAHRLSFGKRDEKAMTCGEVVCADLCGPFEKQSIGGARYFLLLKDEYSHYRYVYFIKEKSDVHNKIRFCVKFMQKEIGRDIKIFRSDNGTEFVNKIVDGFLESEGIKHQLTVSYTPEQNACAEREMRTIVEAARTMLHSNGLPLNIWAEAVNTAVHVLNKTGTSSVPDKTPYELWHKKIVPIDNLKVFGSTVYTHIPKEKRKKLDKKAEKCIFVGYSENVKGYRVYNPENRCVKLVRDVYFNEKDVVSSFENGQNAEIDVAEREEGEIVIRLSLKENVNDDASDENDPNVSGETIISLDDSHESDESFQSTSTTTNEDDDVETNAICDVTLRNVLDSRTRSQNEKNVAGLCYCDTAFLTLSEEPRTYREAMNSEDSEKWKFAMDDEFNSLKKNSTWDLVQLPSNYNIIDNKWVFKKKQKPDGTLDRYKARLVVRGFDQVHGVDYSETFSPVVKYTSVRSIFALAAAQKMKLKQFDIKTAFLYGDLKEDVYMRQPIGYEDGTNKVCKLKRSLYGLKQASRCWNEKFTHFIKSFEFVACDADPCVFVCNKNNELVILAIYVDDGLLAATNEININSIITHLKKHFEVKEFEAKYFLGFEITQMTNGSVHLSQRAYIEKVIERFNMKDANPVTTPMENRGESENGDAEKVDFPYREAIGSLIYLSVGARPDISFAVGYLGRFAEKPTKSHVTAVKRVIRYLKGTNTYGILFPYNGDNQLSLSAYSDADFAGEAHTRKSTSGYCFLLGMGLISWGSERQKSVALSTTESEYIAGSQTVKEMVWIDQLLRNLNQDIEKPLLHMDNQSALKLIKNPEFHKRTKHIDVRYHFIREKFENNLFDLIYVGTHNQLADIFTKPLPRVQFELLRQKLGIVPPNTV